ncbi:MAG: MFS transporter [Micrococcales bacterium]
MSSTARFTKSKLATWSWALRDWAEQPYPTIMQTFIFPVYLTSAVASGVKNADQQLGWATAIAGLLLALMAPVMGRRSDQNGRRKLWLLINTAILVVVTGASFFIEPKPEYFIFGLVLYGIGSVIQESAFINYYAMLKGVTTEKNIGKVSGLAWGLGYVGGIILLLISLVGFVLPEHPLFGIVKENGLNIRTIFLFSAAWILIFTIPLLLFVPEIQKREGTKSESIIGSYRSLFRELGTLRRQAPETFKFLISSAIYRDGLAGIFTFGAVLGTLSFGFNTTSIIFYGIGANIVAAIGASIGGWLDDKVGSRAVILGSLIGLIAGAMAVFFLRDLGPITFWVFGLLLTLFVGPAQASSRTFVARFTPHGREGEVFGLYQTTGRAVSFLSGTMWSLSISFANLAIGSGENTIYGIWGIVIILIVGTYLLTRVHPRPEVINH